MITNADRWKGIMWALLLIGSALLATPAVHAATTIYPSGVVYIGEEGLDISNVLNGRSQIAYWAPGRDPLIEVPNEIRTVSAMNFYASPTYFADHPGMWYAWDGTEPGNIIHILSPSLFVQVWDYDSNTLISSPVSRGTRLKFRIETNLYAATVPAYRDPVVGNIDLLVKRIDPYQEYSSLYSGDIGDPGTGPHSLLANMVNTNIWFWGESGDYYWDTGAVDPVTSEVLYPGGIYTVGVISTLNNMSNNYPEYGKSFAYWNFSLADLTGNIDISSSPDGAAIYLDGGMISSGTTNTILTGISPGSHTVMVTKPDYFAAQRTVTVAEGETVSVSLSMDPIPSEITDPRMVAGVNVVMTEREIDTTIERVMVVPFDSTKPSLDSVGNAPSTSIMDTVYAETLVIRDPNPDANDVKEYIVEVVGQNQQNQDVILETHTVKTLLNYIPQYAAGVHPSPGEAWIPQDPDAWHPACIESATDNYALLLSGGTSQSLNHRRYWNDIAFMYITLIEYGYDPSHIKILMSDGSDPGEDRHIADSGDMYDNSPQDLDGDGGAETILPATKQQLQTTLSTWNIPAGKNLFIFTTAHGDKDNAAGATADDVILLLWNNEYVTDDQLLGWLNQYQSNLNSISLIMEQCNGGGFVDDFIQGSQNRVIYTAARKDQYSWGNEFSDAITTGLAGHNRIGEYDRGADTTSPLDQRVSGAEAFAYGVSHDAYAPVNENPQHGAINMFESDLYLNACTGDESDTITVLTPSDPNIRWERNSRHEIRWRITGSVNTVKITLLRNGVAVSPNPIATNIPAYTGSYWWIVPSGQTLSSYYKIKIEDTSHSAINDVSNNNFAIVAATSTVSYGSVRITSVPTGADIWLDRSDSNYNTNSIVPNQYVGEHTATVKLAGYYEQSLPVLVPRSGFNTYLFTLQQIGTDRNGDPDIPPFGGIAITSNYPTDTTIWMRHQKGGVWSEFEIYGDTSKTFELEPGNWEVYLTKEHYKQTPTKGVYVMSHDENEDRVPTPVHFELEPEDTARIPPIIEGFYIPVDPVMIGDPVSVSAIVTELDRDYPLSIRWEWGDGTEETQETTPPEGEYTYEYSRDHVYPEVGVYTVAVTATDQDGDSVRKAADDYVVIYDPTAGFVTGGGWIISPQGAYTPENLLDPDIEGKATFGFVSKYIKGKTIPSGETEFQFQAAGFVFESTQYDWLVVSGAKAKFKGNGTVNGAGDYGFMLSVIDGQLVDEDVADTFRIKIWDKASDEVIYDNEVLALEDADPSTTIEGGSIVIHNPK